MPSHKPPKLYLDEHLSPRIAKQLRKYGFDVVGIKDRKMLSREDEEQLSVAASEKRAMVTCNFSDYFALNKVYFESNKEHWGIIFTTEAQTGILIKRLLRLLNTLSENDLKNQIFWLNDFQ